MRMDLPPQVWSEHFSECKFVVVSFFTKGFYMREAFELMRTCQLLRVSFYMEQVDETGDWMKNDNYKPVFLARMSNQFSTKPIVWLDADSRIRQYPTKFEGLGPVVAYHHFKERPCAAVIYLGAGHRRTLFLNEWASLLAKDPLGVKLPMTLADVGAPEQYYFEEAVIQQGVAWEELPATYCWLWPFALDHQTSLNNTPVMDIPVIEQMQANRIGKRLLHVCPPPSLTSFLTQ